MRPRRRNHLTGYPISIIDANISHGDLRPYPCPTQLCDLQNTNAVVATIANEEDCPCLTFMEDTCFVKDCGLYYWNDLTGEPKISTPSDFCLGEGCDFGVQCPETSPVVASFENAPSVSSTTSCDSHYFAYRYAYIVEIGGREFEGHWSPPTEMILADATPNTLLSGIPAVGGCHTKVRIYRAATGVHNGESANIEELGGWFNVGTFDIGTPYRDSLSYSSIQRSDPVSPDEFGSPPQDIRCLGCTDNGVFFGISGQDLYYTLPGYPMSWSNRRMVCIPTKAGTPIKAVSRGEDVYVYTDGKPVFLRGVVSDSGISFDLNVVQKNLPLVSVGSVSSGYMGEFFASTDGFYIWNETSLDNLTIDWFGKEQWCKSDPSSIHAAIVENSLVWSTSVDAFVLTFGDRLSQVSADVRGTSQTLGTNILIALNLGDTMPGATAHTLSDNNTLLYHKGGIVYEWDLCADITPANHKSDDVAVSANCCPWTICDSIDTDRDSSITRGEIRFDGRTLTDGIDLSFYKVKCGEKELLKQLTVVSCEDYVLPGCVKTEQFHMEATGCEHVQHFTFASSCFQLIDDPISKPNVKI